MFNQVSAKKKAQKLKRLSTFYGEIKVKKEDEHIYRKKRKIVRLETTTVTSDDDVGEMMATAMIENALSYVGVVCYIRPND